MALKIEYRCSAPKSTDHGEYPARELVRLATAISNDQRKSEYVQHRVFLLKAAIETR